MFKTHLSTATLFLAAASLCSATTITPPFTALGLGATGTANLSGSVLTLTENVTSIASPYGFVVGIGATNGSNTYTVVKTVTNNTGVTWTGYDINYGCAGISTTANCPLSTDFSLTPTASVAATLSNPGTGSLGWTGMSVAPGQTVTFTFDLATQIQNGGGNWVITQQGSATATPEPGSFGIAFLGAGFVAIGAIRRRKRVA